MTNQEKYQEIENNEEILQAAQDELMKQLITSIPSVKVSVYRFRNSNAPFEFEFNHKFFSIKFSDSGDILRYSNSGWSDGSRSVDTTEWVNHAREFGLFVSNLQSNIDGVLKIWESQVKESFELNYNKVISLYKEKYQLEKAIAEEQIVDKKRVFFELLKNNKMFFAKRNDVRFHSTTHLSFVKITNKNFIFADDYGGTYGGTYRLPKINEGNDGCLYESLREQGWSWATETEIASANFHWDWYRS